MNTLVDYEHPSNIDAVASVHFNECLNCQRIYSSIITSIAHRMSSGCLPKPWTIRENTFPICSWFDTSATAVMTCILLLAMILSFAAACSRILDRWPTMSIFEISSSTYGSTIDATIPEPPLVITALYPERESSALASRYWRMATCDRYECRKEMVLFL